MKEKIIIDGLTYYLGSTLESEREQLIKAKKELKAEIDEQYEVLKKMKKAERIASGKADDFTFLQKRKIRVFDQLYEFGKTNPDPKLNTFFELLNKLADPYHEHYSWGLNYKDIEVLDETLSKSFPYYHSVLDTLENLKKENRKLKTENTKLKKDSGYFNQKNTERIKKAKDALEEILQICVYSELEEEVANE